MKLSEKCCSLLKQQFNPREISNKLGIDIDEIINEQPKLIYKALDIIIEEIKDKYLRRNRSPSEINSTKNNPQTQSTNNLNCRM